MMNVPQLYTHAVIATDVVIFTVREGRLQVLLIRMKKEPYAGMWAMPGGLIRPDESLDDAARRILLEKAGGKDIYLEQVAAFGEVGRDPFGRVVSVAYFALIPIDKIQPRTTEEYSDIAWFPVGGLPSLAYDHAEMLATAVERLRERLPYSDIAASLMPRTFTLTELQTVYEVILGEELDKRNFRKRILSSGLIRSTGDQQRGQANRPALLYTFVTRKTDREARA